jgi:formate hydrogenlyase subunit 4
MGTLNLLLMLFTSLFFGGVIIRTKSILSGRKGPGLFQPLLDILRLFRKNQVFSDTSSLLFRLAPTVYTGTILIAMLFVPIGKQEGLLSFPGDFIFFAYVLALGKFFLILSALDTGSSFEGMGASREALFSMLAEPVFFIIMGSLALLNGYTSFAALFGAFHMRSALSYGIGVLASVILITLALIENSRMPLDDPKTHLELTMIHEVMILDHSGFDLGLILHSVNLKFALFGALIADFFLSPTLPTAYALIIYFAIQLGFAILVGLLESFTARFRMNHNPQFILMFTSIALLLFIAILLIV